MIPYKNVVLAVKGCESLLTLLTGWLATQAPPLFLAAPSHSLALLNPLAGALGKSQVRPSFGGSALQVRSRLW